MYFIFLLITGAFLPVVLSCSVPPGAVFYGPTQRTILAPIVFQGRVINTTTSNFPTGQIFDACVEIRKIFKSPFEIPTVVCFGQFGIQELCLTYVFEGSEYVFFLNEDFTARYDGFPEAAYLATQEIVAAVQAGYCQASIDPNCEPPKLENATFEFVKRIQEGRSASVHCRAMGSLPIVATWYRGGELVSVEKQQGNMLKINDATMYDTGRYSCVLKNPAGEATAETYVQIISTACGAFVAVYDDATFTIESPEYPWPYRRGKSCSWRLCPPQGKSLEFNFTTFDLRTFDNLEIVNECDQHRHPWRRFCGSRVSPGSFVSRCNSTCVQIFLDSGISRNRIARGFQATVKATEKEGTGFNVSEIFCNSNLVIKARVAVMFSSELQVNVEVLEIFKQAGPTFIEKGQEIIIKHDFTITDMFGCATIIKEGAECYIFASLAEFIEDGLYIMDFAVDPASTSTPVNFVQQLNRVKTDPPQCDVLPVF